MLKILKIGLVALCMGGILYGAYHYWQRRRSLDSNEPFFTSIKHLAIIPDGNRRWAKKSGLKAWLGHQKGVDPLKMAMKFCCQHNIDHLTIYTWSLENFKRPAEEQEYLFDVLARELASTELNELVKENIRLRFVGDRSYFPEKLLPIIEEIETKTRRNTRLTVNLLFCYGGRQELIQAVQKLAHHVSDGTLSVDAINDRELKKHLWLADTPDPDLIIRTGARESLSNFLTYHAIYSELYFVDCYWPDFTKEHLVTLIKKFEKARRNFGA